jgi:hypothetical protein
MDALRVRFVFDQPEARGEVILETGIYGLHVIVPDVHAEQAVALLDLFWQSHAAAEIADDFGRKRKFHILLYSPTEREDPVGGIAYHPQSRLTLNWGMQEQPVTTVGEIAFELATQV